MGLQIHDQTVKSVSALLSLHFVQHQFSPDHLNVSASAGWHNLFYAATYLSVITGALESADRG